MPTGLHFAVAGATGAVGKEVLAALEERQTPFDRLSLFASSRSAGEELEYRGKGVRVSALEAESFEGVAVALFCLPAEASTRFAAEALRAGTCVIDLSRAFRLNGGAVLSVPEINAASLRQTLRDRPKGHGVLISAPSAAAVGLSVLLKPLHESAGLERVVVSTYQSVSSAGKEGIEELSAQVRALFNQRDVAVRCFPHQIAFNCIPQIGQNAPSGYSSEEHSLIDETRRILGLPELRITATAVQVPTFYCHGASVCVELRTPLSPAQARDLLHQSPGVIVLDDLSAGEYPMGFKLAGGDATYVGRIRGDDSAANGLNLWMVIDNLRKGAALNCVQTAEIALHELAKP